MKWQGGSQLLAPGARRSQRQPAWSPTEVKGQGEIDYADFVEPRSCIWPTPTGPRRGIEARSEEEYELGSAEPARRYGSLAGWSRRSLVVAAPLAVRR